MSQQRATLYVIMSFIIQRRSTLATFNKLLKNVQRFLRDYVMRMCRLVQFLAAGLIFANSSLAQAPPPPPSSESKTRYGCSPALLEQLQELIKQSKKQESVMRAVANEFCTVESSRILDIWLQNEKKVRDLEFACRNYQAWEFFDNRSNELADTFLKFIKECKEKQGVRD